MTALEVFQKYLELMAHNVQLNAVNSATLADRMDAGGLNLPMS